MGRTEKVVLFGLLGLILVFNAMTVVSGRSVSVPAPVQPMQSPAAPHRLNFKYRQPDALRTLDYSRIQAAPEPILPGVYSIERPGLTVADVEGVGGRDVYEWIEPDYAIALDRPVHTDYADGLQFFQTPNDPLISQQYSVRVMGLRDAWNVTTGGGVVIAIVDSGVECSHPDLAGRCLPGRSFVDGVTSTEDDNGHGTHVGGIASATGNNGLGVAGIAYNSRILPVKVLSANGGGYHSWIAQGIAYAADSGAKVINLSLGGDAQSKTLEEAINYALSKNALPVCASGNSGNATPMYPAAYAGCLAVGATTPNDQRASFSSYGKVDVGAPGQSILSTVRGGQYQSWDGTSMAAPNVAGVAALLFSRNPNYSPADVRRVIENTADNVGAGLGKGRVNAKCALGLCSSPAPQPTAQPAPTQPTPQHEWTSAIQNALNAERAKHGLYALRIDTRLGDAAAFHNRWLQSTGEFCHNCPGEPDVAQRIRNAGYPLSHAGEIIGKGFLDPAHMMSGWMNSSGHRAAVLTTSWVDLGCNFLQGPTGEGWDRYWSCELATPNGQPAPQPTQPPWQPQPTATRQPLPPTPTPWWNVPQPTPTPWWQQPQPTATARQPFPVPPSPTVPSPIGGGDCPAGYRCAFIAPNSPVWIDSFYRALCSAGGSVRCEP